jgi:hypothetical protein
MWDISMQYISYLGAIYSTADAENNLYNKVNMGNGKA